MSQLDLLVQRYQRFITPPWPANVAGPQKVLFAMYDPMDERRLRARLGEFELATKRARHGWLLCDLTDAFARWITGQKYREAYFEEPEDLHIALADFERFASDQLRAVLNQEAADDNTVVAVTGVASLFGFMRTAKLVEMTEDDIRGRMLLFFPGQHDNATYRLLDARDGWNCFHRRRQARQRCS